MGRRGRPRKLSGSIYARSDSQFLWVHYRNREGDIITESAGTTDPEEAERFLREQPGNNLFNILCGVMVAAAADDQ